MPQRSLHTFLLWTSHFPPAAASGAFGAFGFARHLPKFGWRTIVVAPPGLPTEPVDGDLLNRVPAGTPPYPVPYPKGIISKPLRRLAPRAIWLPRAWATCQRALRDHRCDAIVTSGPPHIVHLLGLLLKRRYRLSWVADFRDPWVAGMRLPGLAPRKRSGVARLEAAVMREAHSIAAHA